MSTTYLTLAEIAELAGTTVGSIRTYHHRATANRQAGNPRPGDLPPEDIRLSQTPGWSEGTIATWLENRPRRPRNTAPAVTDAQLLDAWYASRLTAGVRISGIRDTDVIDFLRSIYNLGAADGIVRAQEGTES